MAKISSPRRTTSTASPPEWPRSCPSSGTSASGTPCARSGPESWVSALMGYLLQEPWYLMRTACPPKPSLPWPLSYLIFFLPPLPPGEEGRGGEGFGGHAG